MDLARLRSQFPVLERLAYLNAGSVGPVPRAAVAAAERDLADQLEHGRAGRAQFEAAAGLAERLRERVARLLGADPAEVALTGATTDGVNAVIGGLELGAGDEVLTSDEEHPGLLAPLGLARRRRGVAVRVVPFERLAAEVTPQTGLVACSHVSWISGRVADSAAIAATGVPLLLDGAQGLGAVAVDVKALGCTYYAASGQKWLCGPVGSGYLYVRSDALAALSPLAPGYGTVADPLRALDLELAAGAARLDTGMAPGHHSAWALAALDALEAEGFAEVRERAVALAGDLAAALAAEGLAVGPRGESTLVSWEAPDPEAEAARLLGAGFLVRHLPGRPYVRASVGGWTSREELERLVAVASGR